MQCICGCCLLLLLSSSVYVTVVCTVQFRLVRLRVCVRACFYTKLVYMNFQLKTFWSSVKQTQKNITSHFSVRNGFVWALWYYLCGWCLYLHYMRTLSICRWSWWWWKWWWQHNVSIWIVLQQHGHTHTHTHATTTAKNAIRKINFQNRSFDG